MCCHIYEILSKIIDLPEDRVGTYCKYLEDWSSKFDDEGGHKGLGKALLQAAADARAREAKGMAA